MISGLNQDMGTPKDRWPITCSRLVLLWLKPIQLLRSRGPSFGYVPQSSKCFVVVSVSQFDEARRVLGGLGVQVVTGHR